jgi:hypothetical protein
MPSLASLNSVTGGPNRFGPGVPLRKPSSISSQIAPMIGTSPISAHQPDLSRYFRRGVGPNPREATADHRDMPLLGRLP